MIKKKICVIYGGKSTEHNVSVESSKAIVSNLDKNKYAVSTIYIAKNGEWYDENNDKIDDIIGCLKNIDVAFPVLHGLYGEDGTIQGLFELFGIKYVGCGILASSVGMDKVYTKIIFDRANLKQAKYIYINKVNDRYIYINERFDEKEVSLDEIEELVSNKLKYPVFIKPSNSGSSIGLNKANNGLELKQYIEYASEFDNKVLIEENIVGREIECSVLGNDDIEISTFGEIIPDDVFYSYEAKYNNQNSKLIIPAKLSTDEEIKLKQMAKKAYKALDAEGLARVDFFVTEKEIYINEVNTMPGFTEISMYPKLWEKSGIRYSVLLDRLIELALDN